MSSLDVMLRNQRLFLMTALVLILGCPALPGQQPKQAEKQAPPKTNPTQKVEVQQAESDSGIVAGDDATKGMPSLPQGAPPVDDYRTGLGNDWFEETRKNLGTYFQEEEAVGKFRFKNPRNEPHQMRNLVQSCQCARSVITIGDRLYHLTNDPTNSTLYRIVKNPDGAETRERVAYIEVGAGEQGEIDVHMTMHGHQGHKESTLQINTSDEKLPQVNLAWRATGATYFIVSPPDFNLGEMTWSDQREFQFEVSSPILKDFNLLEHDPLAQKLSVQTEKTTRGDRTVWLVKGVYGPGVDERDSGGTITFATDAPGRKVTMRVMAMVKGPIDFKPGGFVSMNLIRHGVGAKTKVTITPNDDFDLQVTSLEVERLSVKPEFVSITSKKEGKSLVIEIEVSKDTPKGSAVRGMLKIHLNHPSSSMKEVQFHGLVR